MISIDCKHPDIEEFINLKSKLGVCEKANISVRVTDEFMKAAINDEDWVTEFYSPETGKITRTFKAKELLMLLAKQNHRWAEPGILYWDTIENYNMLNNDENFHYAGVNPCAEEPLPIFGACLLGSLNLNKFVVDEFTPNARIDYDELERATAIAIAALNQVLDEGIPLHPLKEQQEEVSKWRQVGLGTFGLGDAMIRMGLTYGSDESLKRAETIYSTIAKTSIEASLELSKKFGCYPKCNKEKLAESSFIKAMNLPENTIKDIKEYGLRNSQLLTCAPTGSIATMCESSSGVEPIFALKYVRKTQSLSGKDTFYDVETKIVKEYREATGNIEDLPEYFITSGELNPLNRIKMQGVLQKYTDASISSTLNLRQEATVEDVYNIYVNAWKYGLKGCTIYRSNCDREGILTTKKPVKMNENVTAPKRQKQLPCDIYKVKAHGEQFIVAVGLFDGKPYEVFAFRLEDGKDIKITDNKGIITKNAKCNYGLKSADLDIPNMLKTNISVEEKASTLYTSQLMRHGIPLKYIIKTAKKVNGDSITTFTSCVCRVLSKYLPKETSGVCPNCGAPLVHEGGCVHCSICEYSKCE